MKGISLPAVLQVIDLERKSCSVEAKSDDCSGSLYFSDGMLVHAATGSLVGEDAAYEILSWQDPEYRIDTTPFAGSQTLASSIHQLLLETARRYDESQRPEDDGDLPAITPNGNGSEPEAREKAGPDESETDRAMTAPEAATPASRLPELQAEAPAGAAARTPGLNVASLQAAIDTAQAALNGALVAADVCLAADGTPIVGYNSMPAAVALFNQVTAQMNRSLPRCHLPGLGRYLLAELGGDQTVLFASAGAYQLCLIVDTSQVQLGMLLNLVLPEILASFEAGDSALVSP